MNETLSGIFAAKTAAALVYSWKAPSPGWFVARERTWLDDCQPHRINRLLRPVIGLYSRNHTIALLELGDIRPDFVDFTGDVFAENHGPFLNEEAMVLNLPIDWVDCNGMVLDYNIVGTGFGNFGFTDLRLSKYVLSIVWHR